MMIEDRGTEKKRKNSREPLPAYKWTEVFRALRPFLRPFGDSGEGRLDFYHRSLSKAVRRRYSVSSIFAVVFRSATDLISLAATHLVVVLVGSTIFKKARGSIISNQIWIKFGRTFCEVKPIEFSLPVT